MQRTMIEANGRPFRARDSVDDFRNAYSSQRSSHARVAHGFAIKHSYKLSYCAIDFILPNESVLIISINAQLAGCYQLTFTAKRAYNSLHFSFSTQTVQIQQSKAATVR